MALGNHADRLVSDRFVTGVRSLLVSTYQKKARGQLELSSRARSY